MSDFEEKVKQSLDNSVEELDSKITRQLRQSRYHALQQEDNASFNWRLPTGAFASLALVALAVGMFMQSNQDALPEMMAENMEPIDVMVMNENIELLEDLEFIQWLELNSEDAG